MTVYVVVVTDKKDRSSEDYAILNDTNFVIYRPFQGSDTSIFQDQIYTELLCQIYVTEIGKNGDKFIKFDHKVDRKKFEHFLRSVSRFYTKEYKVKVDLVDPEESEIDPLSLMAKVAADWYEADKEHHTIEEVIVKIISHFYYNGWKEAGHSLEAI